MEITDRRRLVVAEIVITAEAREDMRITSDDIRRAVRHQMTDRCPAGTCTSHTCCDYRTLARLTMDHLVKVFRGAGE